MWSSLSQPCACGDTITARSPSDYDVTAAVAKHNRSSQAHLIWSARILLDRGPLVLPQPENAPRLTVVNGRAVAS